MSMSPGPDGPPDAVMALLLAVKYTIAALIVLFCVAVILGMIL